jgi:hypothetical protein
MGLTCKILIEGVLSPVMYNLELQERKNRLISPGEKFRGEKEQLGSI